MINQSSNTQIMVIGGSLPPQFEVHDLKRIIKLANTKNIPVVVDCPGPILKHFKDQKLLMIKPNLNEFQVMTNSRSRSIATVKKKALELTKMASYVCVSSVEGGALFVSKSGCYFGRIPRIKIRSTVGAGDSMVGAMVAQLLKEKNSTSEVLRWGLAAAAATLAETGTSLGQSAEIEKLYEKTVVREV